MERKQQFVAHKNRC